MRTIGRQAITLSLAFFSMLALAASPASAKGAVDELLKGIDQKNMSAEQQLEKLMDNFTKVGFKYTGISGGGVNVTDDTLSGDCRTLTRLFNTVAREHLNIKSVAQNGERPAENKKAPSEQGMLFVKGGGPIVDSARGTGSVDGGKHWIFADHYWAEYDPGNGAKIVYDILFNKKHKASDSWKTWTIVTAHKGSAGREVELDGVQYYEETEPTDYTRVWIPSVQKDDWYVERNKEWAKGDKQNTCGIVRGAFAKEASARRADLKKRFSVVKQCKL